MDLTTMPNRDILLQYANLKIQEKKVAEELDLIKAGVLSEVQAIRGDTDSPVQLSDLPGYSFSIQNRKTWTYSAAVIGLTERLKEKKKEEEQTGQATFEESPSVVFTSPKVRE